MTKQVYICEKCLSPYETEDRAKSCEEQHCSFKMVKIVGMSLSKRSWVPDKIFVEINEPEPFTKQTHNFTYIIENKK